MKHQRILQLFLFGVLIVVFLIFSIFVARYVSESEIAQEIVQQFGYLGIVLLGIVGGFNLLVPIPAATFTPIFVAAGFPAIGIIAALAIGTTIADLISYYIGAFGRHFSGVEEGPLFEKIRALREKHDKWVIPFMFLHASFAPYPNEVMVIPLAFLGLRLRTFILPLLVGNTIYNTVLVLGISSIFDLVL